VALSVAAAEAAEPGDIDEALDGLLATVDNLVRDLDVEEAEPSPFEVGLDAERLGVVVSKALGIPRRRGAFARTAAVPTVHSKAFVVGLGFVLIAFEFLVLAWLTSNL
jgi:hypothetical protein